MPDRHTADPSTLDGISARVAVAVDLAEGPAGVRTILRRLSGGEPVSTRDLSRSSGLPVPIVAAICNELRGHGLVSSERPARLTAAGRALTADLGAPAARVVCDACEGRGFVLPPGLDDLVAELAELEDAAPAARMELDQAHCTPETKIRRALLLQQTGALASATLLLVGDDDLTSLTIGAMAARGLVAAPERMSVVDVDGALVDFIASRSAAGAAPVDAIVHDLREPLPPSLTGSHTVAFTDPPYTEAGAALFLSRAVEGLAPGGGRDVFFAFGPKGPDVTLQVQQLIARTGLVTRRMLPRFNDYLGAGILGGTSDLYHLATTGVTSVEVSGTYGGELYTGDRVRAPRRYVCAACSRAYLVGPGEAIATVAALKEKGCAGCAGTTFRPGPLVSRPPGGRP